MDVELSQDESEAVQKALRSYLSDLRMEITDTDNPEYKRELREERGNLEAAITKLSGTSEGQSASGGSASNAAGSDATGGDESAAPVMRIVRIWWSDSD